MSSLVAVQTITPILLLVGMGYLSRRIGVLREGDERVLNAYVYYFALPALFFITIAEVRFTAETLIFILAGTAPVLIVTAILILIYLARRVSKETLYLLILCTAFGSLAFFGIPFITFAFPEQGEQLATFASAVISPVSVFISIAVLELYALEKSTVFEGLKRVMKRLSRNILILSIFSGIPLSVAGVPIPAPISASLHLLGSTTSTVALFMLGVYLYGRKYIKIRSALELSLLRMLLLPAIVLIVATLLNIQDVEKSTLVLMNGMPLAISTIVLSERYNFHKETIASLILVSSLAAGIYLNLWLLLLEAL